MGRFSKNYRTFYPKIVTKLSKIWVWIWDPGSGKNLFWTPDPGVKKAADPGSGSATLQKEKNRGKRASEFITVLSNPHR